MWKQARFMSETKNDQSSHPIFLPPIRQPSTPGHLCVNPIGGQATIAGTNGPLIRRVRPVEPKYANKARGRRSQAGQK
jgi:hypothetical protein